MIKALLASALLVGASVLPAAADDYDTNVIGGRAYLERQGFQNADDNRGYYNPRPGYDGPRSEFRGPRWGDRLSERQLTRRLRYQGFYNVDIFRQRDDVAIARAEARGRDVILVVDARSGAVLKVRPTRDGWRSDRGWHGGWGMDWRRW